jgi:hypothetical protein
VNFQPRTFWTVNAGKQLTLSVGRILADTSSLCRGNPELKYEVAADEDPDVPAWDDAGFELEEDFGKMAIGA